MLRAVGNLWDEEEPKVVNTCCTAGECMRKGQFNAIKKHIPHPFAIWNAKDSDPWWQAAGDVEGFKENLCVIAFLKRMRSCS